jgi:hypothetical protein
VSWTHDLVATLRRLVGARERPADPVVGDVPAPSEAPIQAPEPVATAAVQPELLEPEIVEPEPLVAAIAPETAPDVAAPIEPERASPVPEARSAAGPGSLTLRLESERGPASVFEVTRSGATIGRAHESTIRLDDLSVSRRHARIAWKQGAYWLSDVGSMGGTWVDGSKLNAPRRIAAGQRIDIGVCRLTVAAAPQLPVSSGSSSHSGNGSGSRRSGGA